MTLKAISAADISIAPAPLRPRFENWKLRKYMFYLPYFDGFFCEGYVKTHLPELLLYLHIIAILANS